ncbi:flotillin-like FloA family protein [Bremerella sp. T1]|uniref:flotillin-like FloA family protein n=1 Tax=Bremerella sp. TYQ1 TaxID=3119568 RepID=UPI001CCEBBA9|nr:flotillin-like FloA family protein [Bremerella volcania]UBM36982.1 flotillin-like FloA family protein [Bremerella volcania]
MIAYLSLVLAGGILAVVAMLLIWYFRLWLQAYSTGTSIGFVNLIFMSLRGVNPHAVVECKIMAVQSRLAIVETRVIEALYLARGDIRRVTLAVIAADRAGIRLDWDTAAAIDLAGRDILDAVKTSILPKVILIPDPDDARSDVLYGVAKDGVQLKVMVRVTVRTNLLQLIGGATESTVVARVGQGVISAIGSCNCYQEALRDPMLITRKVLDKGLDADTAYAIVSIDIADIDVGRNIGAKLQIDQASADFRIALALAEKRRAMAIAKHQEMRAKHAKSRANVVHAEAEIPASLGQAFRDGNIQTQNVPVSQQRTSHRFPLIANLATSNTAIVPN